VTASLLRLVARLALCNEFRMNDTLDVEESDEHCFHL
jgi:hypothetical protein